MKDMNQLRIPGPRDVAVKEYVECHMHRMYPITLVKLHFVDDIRDWVEYAKKALPIY